MTHNTKGITTLATSTSTRVRDSQIRAMVMETSDRTTKSALVTATSHPVGELFTVGAIVSEGLNLGDQFVAVSAQISLDAKRYGLHLRKMEGPTCTFVRVNE